MILVLAHDCSQTQLDEILSECKSLGWTCEVSRGTEQTIVTLAGSADPAALEERFGKRTDLDLVPILSHREYRYLRTRRRMLAGMAGGLGVLTAMGAGIPVLGFLMPPKGVIPDRDLVRVAAQAEIKEHSGWRVTLLGQPVLLVRLENNRWFALSAICTHMNICHLDWNEERRELVCPCHGGAFDVYGNVVQGPPAVPLESYGVELVGPDVFVRRKA
ncbi:MAG: Rieske 2Fe-2S domain-containing protein [Planctomycetes bacterium]|nr:Rieske 2Fe-2S domain-containing protein [Planctomycetota bacterium]